MLYQLYSLTPTFSIIEPAEEKDNEDGPLSRFPQSRQELTRLIPFEIEIAL